MAGRMHTQEEHIKARFKTRQKRILPQGSYLCRMKLISTSFSFFFAAQQRLQHFISFVTLKVIAY